MTIELRLAQNNDAGEWDAIINESSLGTLFHTWNWLKITEKHTNSCLYPLIGVKKGNPIGVFPIFLQKRGPLRAVFSPPPNAVLFYLGPVLVGYDTLKQEKRESNYLGLQNLVHNFIIDDLKAQYVGISLTPGLKDPRPFTWLGYSFEPQYDFVVDLSGGLDSLKQTLNKNQRQNLSRARNRGITVELGGKKEYETILDLMDIRYAQQGKKVKESREYFSDLYDVYKDNMKIFVAKLNNEIVTGSIDFQYKDSHYSWIGNPKPKSRITPTPNDLLIWESVCYAQEMGMKYYVTMNAAGNKRLHSYYASKFNPDLNVHFALKKTTFIMKILETGYSVFFKSLL